MHDLVIFDCDGVLVDSEAISNEMLARMLTQEGLPTTLSEARRACQGLLLTDVRDQAQAKLGRPFPPDWVAEYEHERDEAFRRELKPVDGAAEAVQRVKTAGLKICVASQGQLALWRYRHNDSYVARRVMSRRRCIGGVWSGDENDDFDVAESIASLDEARAVEIAGDMLRLYELIAGLRTDDGCGPSE